MNKDLIRDKLDEDIELGDRVLYFKDQNIGYWASGSQKKGIWRVIKDDLCGTVTLQDIGDRGHIFETAEDNVVDIKYIEIAGALNNNYITEKSLVQIMPKAVPTNKSEQENKTMKSNIVDANVDAAKVAAKVTAGKTLNTVVLTKLKPHMPFGTKAYADTPFGAIVVANMANFAVQNFASGNSKARYAADAMMQSAMVEFAAEFNFEEMLAELLSSVELPEVEKTAE